MGVQMPFQLQSLWKGKIDTLNFYFPLCKGFGKKNKEARDIQRDSTGGFRGRFQSSET